jgi:hypothetical protein
MWVALFSALGGVPKGNLQTCTIWPSRTYDPTLSKALSFGVYFVEAAQTFLLTQSVFHGFAEGFGNLISHDEIGTMWFSVPIMSGISEW